MNSDRGGISIQNRKKEDLLVILEEAQQKFGYLPEELMEELAQSFDMPLSEVYGIASFYSFLSTQPLAKNIIRVCKSLPCHMKNADLVMQSIEKELGIRPGETTSDHKFSFTLTNCIGACDMAPAMMINADVYGNLTPEKITEILKSYK